MIDICPCSVVAYNPDFRVFRDIHALLSDLYFSTRLTKFDAVKGPKQTYIWSPESIKFWWVSDLIYWVKMDVEVEFWSPYTNAV